MSRHSLVAGLLSLALLSGCATETVFRPTPSPTAVADKPFAVSGRLSVNADGKGHVANFEWTHQPAADQLSVNSPLGNTVARLERTDAGVTLQADGKTWQAGDVEQLTEQVLGWRLPMSNLAWWIRGLPAPGAEFSHAADGSLLQQGWQIRFVSDADAVGEYPKRVEMQRDKLTIRLVPQVWH
ncbi:lipoprotein insertase outer membrane protein LolB [uncultured Aquitalea sp.]|uniref:lipoprotein insertase outer membrane protein LolB n=1 Tax=uncultured Aquitalea sp. TaxID=540272 RepID=UPI0025FCB03D|nr:lipoprotein insertase outer membrane protein LolB [uncultured Aquitalea sp.]